MHIQSHSIFSGFIKSVTSLPNRLRWYGWWFARADREPGNRARVGAGPSQNFRRTISAYGGHGHRWIWPQHHAGTPLDRNRSAGSGAAARQAVAAIVGGVVTTGVGPIVAVAEPAVVAVVSVVDAAVSVPCGSASVITARGPAAGPGSRRCGGRRNGDQERRRGDAGQARS